MYSTNKVLPYGRQGIDDSDISAVVEVLRSDWLTTGPKVQEFEETFADKVGAKYAVSCSSGTAALHLAMLALDVNKDDKVIVPTMTFLSTANASVFVGADVEFADVDPNNGLLDINFVETLLENDNLKKISAIIPVHLYGQCVDMERINELADKFDIAVMEDACHALGTKYYTKEGNVIPVGACSHSMMAIFSFHPVKTITTGEGGIVTTNSKEIYEKLKRFRNHGIIHDPDEFTNKELAYAKDGDSNPWYYEMADIGYNYRASDIQCALGISQLSRLESFIAERQSLADLYDTELKSLFPLVKPVKRQKNCETAWHIYAVLIDFEKLSIDRAALMNRLLEKGITTQVHYIPVHMQPYYMRRYSESNFSGALDFYKRVLTLPLFPGMYADDVLHVTQSLKQCIE